jgi:hypothetical protein
MDQVAKMQVGEYKGNCAFTITYTSGDTKLVIMQVGIAESFVEQLSKVIHELRYVERQMAGSPGFSEGVGIGEGVSMQLTQPTGENDGQA